VLPLRESARFRRLPAAASARLPPGRRAGDPFDPAPVAALVREALEAWDVPGCAVAIVRDDEVIYLAGHGVKELGCKDPVTPDTLFPIASCTKAFTTTAMAMLVDEGKMAWDDPVRKHVGYFRLADPLADANVTLRDLVCHRTGVRGHDLLWYRSPWTQEEVIRRVGRVKPDGPFRASFHYQSTMFTAAGHAVASASRMPWGDFVRTRIFTPLGMTGANLTTDEADRAPDRASPHRKDRSGRALVIPRYRIDVPEPAGSVNAGAGDLARWVRFQLGDGTFAGRRLVSAANLRETHTPQNPIGVEGGAQLMHPETQQMSYGMAWLIQDYRGHRQVSHAGAIDGFRAHVTLLPDSEVGFVILANLHHTRMNLALSNSLVDLLLGLKKKDWNAHYLDLVRQDEADARQRECERQAGRPRGTKPAREPGAYVGRYEEPAYGTAEVTLENGALRWRWNCFGGPLKPFHDDTFLLDTEAWGTWQVQFILGADGEVASLAVGDPLGVEFKKVKEPPAVSIGWIRRSTSRRGTFTGLSCPLGR
jgi:CubicO group peptidase (beta-lactamase class C family)